MIVGEWDIVSCHLVWRALPRRSTGPLPCRCRGFGSLVTVAHFEEPLQFRHRSMVAMVMLLFVVMVILLVASKHGPFISRLAQITCAGRPRRPRAKSSLGISTSEDESRIKLCEVLRLRRPLAARVRVVGLPDRGDSARWRVGVSWRRRGAFFLGAHVIPNEELSPVAGQLNMGSCMALGCATSFRGQLLGVGESRGGDASLRSIIIPGSNGRRCFGSDGRWTSIGAADGI